MDRPSLKDIEKILTELVFPFSKIERDLSIPGRKRRPENDAEHSWSVALIACMLVERIDPKLDVGKVCQLAVAHDLVEVYAGDSSIWDRSARASKHKREERAMATIKSRFKTFPWLSRTIKTYELRRSPEARFVSAIDKFVATFVRYLDERHKPTGYFINKQISKQHFQQATHELKLKAEAHPTVGGYYKELLQLFELHPDWFSPG